MRKYPTLSFMRRSRSTAWWSGDKRAAGAMAGRSKEDRTGFVEPYIQPDAASSIPGDDQRFKLANNTIGYGQTWTSLVFLQSRFVGKPEK